MTLGPSPGPEKCEVCKEHLANSWKIPDLTLSLRSVQTQNVDTARQNDLAPHLLPNPGLSAGPQILSFCALYGTKIQFGPWIFLEADFEVIIAQWYQSVDSSANSHLNNNANDNVLWGDLFHTNDFGVHMNPKLYSVSNRICQYCKCRESKMCQSSVFILLLKKNNFTC